MSIATRHARITSDNTVRDVSDVAFLQATLTDSGSLLLWGPDIEQPPEVSEDLPGIELGDYQTVTCDLAIRRRRVMRREVTGYEVAVSDLLLPLVALDADADVSDSVRCFSLAAKLALELASQKRVVPTVSGGKAQWTALLSRGEDRRRAEAIARALPAAARAIPASERPLRLRPSAEIVRAFLDAAVDALYRLRKAYPGPSRGWMRAWAEGLRNGDSAFSPKDARWQAMPERIANWAASADAPSPRVGFALDLPKGGDGRFPLRLVLHAPGEPGRAIGITKAWRAGAMVDIEGQTFPRPAEAALRGLARAAKLHPALRACIQGSEPRNLLLDADEAWSFLDQGRPALQEAGFEVRLPPDFEQAGRQRIRARIRLGTANRDGSLGDSLTYRWEVVVGDHVLSGDEFAEMQGAGQPIVNWRGTWVFLDPAEISKLPEDLTEAGQLELPAALCAVFTGQHDGVPVVADEGLQLLLNALRSPPDLEPPPRLDATLRGYQVTGFSWLSTLGELGLGALLADDMGLGKTLQLIAHLLHRADSGRHEPRPSLVVCPTSVLGNWERELDRFAPALEVLRWHGQQRGDESLEDVDVVLTTYGLLVRDQDILSAHEWDVVALDEAQSIKNPSSQRAKAARELQARHRVALTGTPVENRLQELWSVMEFLVPGLLGPRRRFQREVAVPVERFGDNEVATRLRHTVSPFLLRRVKTDPNVIDDLPDKVERRDYCALTSEQQELYRDEVDRAMEEIRSASEMERRGRVLAMLTALKQICNHPLHFLKKRESNPDLTLRGRSGKLDAITERIDAITDVGERAVIFTQYREMGDILQRHLAELLEQSVPFLHGGTPVHTRDDMVRAFQEDDWAAPVLIVSLRAGGTGLNLTRASHVLHYDRWWNPAVEDQATDRAYRIGQRRAVLVHKLVCEGTLEERIDQLLDEKRELFQKVVGSGERWVTELNDDQLRQLVMLAGDPSELTRKAS